MNEWNQRSSLKLIQKQQKRIAMQIQNGRTIAREIMNIPKVKVGI